jgi:hypothetical protein
VSTLVAAAAAVSKGEVGVLSLRVCTGGCPDFDGGPVSDEDDDDGGGWRAAGDPCTRE